MTNIFEIIINGDEDKAIQLVTDGIIDKDMVDSDHHESMLQWAIQHRCLRLAIVLVNMKCNMNIIGTSSGMTPLDVAINDYPKNNTFHNFLQKNGAKLSADIINIEEIS
jgi:hypothetical protein